jgi:nitroreductase
VCGAGENAMIKSKDVLKLIKESGATRRFVEKAIPENMIDTILEAGEWGLSILGMQPWYYVCITNKSVLRDIASVLEKQSHFEDGGVDKIMAITAQAVKSAYAVIAIYNKENIQARTKRLNPKYIEHAKMAELQAIGASVQNMILMTTTIGLKCVWVNTPTYVETEINKVLGENKKLMSCLVLGFADSTPNRSNRVSRDSMIKILR